MNIFAFGIGEGALLTSNEALWVYLLLYAIPAILIVCALASFAYGKGKSKMGQKVSPGRLYVMPVLLVFAAVILYGVTNYLYPGM